MFFSKKYNEEISKLRSLIENQKFEIEATKYKFEELIRENSESIVEIDDKLCDSSVSHDKSNQSIEDRISNLEEKASDLSKMQKVIMTWIIVLCTTSLFSILLHNEII